MIVCFVQWPGRCCLDSQQKTFHVNMLLLFCLAILGHVLLQLQLHGIGPMSTHRSRFLVRHSLNGTHQKHCGPRERLFSGYDLCQCHPFKPDHGWISPSWTDEVLEFKNVSYKFAFNAKFLRSSPQLPKFFTSGTDSLRQKFLLFFRVVVPWYHKNTEPANAEVQRNSSVLSRIPIRYVPFGQEWWEKKKKKLGWKVMKKWVDALKKTSTSVLKDCWITNQQVAKNKSSTTKSRKRRKRAVTFGERRSRTAFQRFHEALAVADLHASGSGFVIFIY